MYLQSHKIGCSDKFTDLVTNVILQGTYRIAQKFDGKNFYESLVVCQIHQSFPRSNFCAIRQYTVYN